MSSSPKYTPGARPEMFGCTFTVTGSPVVTAGADAVAVKIPGVEEVAEAPTITGVGEGLVRTTFFAAGFAPFAGTTKIRPVVENDNPGLFAAVVTFRTTVAICGEFPAVADVTLIWP